jgi:lysophospholipase L1-like esterase
MQKARALLCLFLFVSLLFPLSMGGCQDARTEETTDANTDQTTQNLTERTEQPTMNETTITTPQEKPNTPTNPIELVANTYDFCKNREHFKRYGRMLEKASGLTCDFTASGIEFCGKMLGDVVVSLSCSADTYFTVFIDGVRQEERFYATSATKQLCIASFAEAGEHTVRMVKQTEAQWSLCLLESVSITGFLYPAPTDREFLIEFIGDSLTSGYGNLGDSSTPVAGIALMQDGTQTYAFLTAEALDVDYNMVSCSGIGIAKGWTAVNEIDFYQKSSYYRSDSVYHNDNSRIPDVIVINLGTNDQDRGCDEASFKAGVKELIAYLRAFYGAEVPIVWAYDMMSYGCFTWARPVLAELGGERAGIYTVQLTRNNAGAGHHPALEGHYKSSEQLVQFILDKKLLDKVN